MYLSQVCSFKFDITDSKGSFIVASYQLLLCMQASPPEESVDAGFKALAAVKEVSIEFKAKDLAL